MESSKICNKCNTPKPLSFFTPAKKNKDGLHHSCKSCSNKITRAFFKTKRGIITSIYSAQLRSKKRNVSPPTYSVEWLKEWVFNNPIFDTLYNEWVASKYEKDLKPSVDRINDYIGYTKENIQLMTWEENRTKYHNDVRNKINNKTKKNVAQYDKKGNLITIFCSIIDASKKTGCHWDNIGKCCNHPDKNKTSGGFVWKFL